MEEAGWNATHPLFVFSFPWMLDSDVVLTHCVGGKLAPSLFFFFLLFYLYFGLTFFPSVYLCAPACYRTCVWRHLKVWTGYRTLVGWPPSIYRVARLTSVCTLFFFPRYARITTSPPFAGARLGISTQIYSPSLGGGHYMYKSIEDDTPLCEPQKERKKEFSNKPQMKMSLCVHTPTGLPPPFIGCEKVLPRSHDSAFFPFHSLKKFLGRDWPIDYWLYTLYNRNRLKLNTSLNLKMWLI